MCAPHQAARTHHTHVNNVTGARCVHRVVWVWAWAAPTGACKELRGHDRTLGEEAANTTHNAASASTAGLRVARIVEPCAVMMLSPSVCWLETVLKLGA